MRTIVFEGRTWNVYEDIRKKDKTLHKNICKVIIELQHHDPTQGLGKPEPLKHNLSGYWSRRISQKDRIVYKFDDEHLYIFAIGGHYDSLQT